MCATQSLIEHAYSISEGHCQIDLILHHILPNCDLQIKFQTTSCVSLLGCEAKVQPRSLHLDRNLSESPSRIVPTWPADVCHMTVLHNPHMEPIVQHVWRCKAHSITWFHVGLIWYHPMLFATCISTSVPPWHLRCEWCAVAVPES